MPLLACLACLATLSAGSPAQRRFASSTTARQLVRGAGASVAGSTFRLGTAAQPLGWSTAVGDVNTDGKPDVVIADHTSKRSGSYGYRIQFAVSGISDRNLAFESSQAAVTVRLSDVDHDNDLDVVVRAAASREVVGIWLNDGQGRFQSADVGRFATEAEPASLFALGEHSASPGRCEAPPRRAADPVLAQAHTAPTVSSHFWLDPGSLLEWAANSSPTALRGPPSPLA